MFAVCDCQIIIDESRQSIAFFNLLQCERNHPLTHPYAVRSHTPNGITDDNGKPFFFSSN